MTLTARKFNALALLSGMLACLPFFFGLPGAFVFDDNYNIVGNSGIQLQSMDLASVANAAFSMQFGGTTRLLPTLTFALDYWRGSGLDPEVFKTTNIVIHGLTTFFVALFFQGLLNASGIPVHRARIAALALALAWALHPLQVSSVLYVVQRMQTMATLFLVLSLLAYLKARKAQISGESGRTGWLLAGLCWVLALGCKEDAILLPAYTLALELTVLRFSAADPVFSRQLRRGYMVMGFLATAIFVLAAIPRFWSWEHYPGRDFSSYERLLTQARVLWLYLGEILFPLPAHMPFYYDWLQPSRGLLQPWTTLLAIVLTISLLVVAWLLRNRRPLFALGIFLFFAGHLVTSNVIGLELAFEHRNHFPLLGVVLAAGDLLLLAAGHLGARTASLTAITCALLLGLGGATFVRSQSWSSGLRLALVSTEIAPASPRAWNSLCVIYFEQGGGSRANNPNLGKAIAACEKGASVAKDSITGLTNVVAFKSIQGTATQADWERYFHQLRRVTMSAENAFAIWVILNNARNGAAISDENLLEAIDIVGQRAPLKPIESAAFGYFILGHTQQPDKAYPYFARAVQRTSDHLFAKDLIEDLRNEGHPEWSSQLEALAREKIELGKRANP